jgi:regulator of protease activity HflC (stomatin/prohibitin superfamily)
MLSENGMRAEPIKSGKHWILPWFEKVVIYPIGLQTYTMSGKALEGQKIGDDSITARTKDGHEVHIDCSLTFQVDQKNVITLHEMWQDRYIKELIRPVLRSVIRNSTSQYSIGQVNSEKRLDLEKEFEEELKKLINQNGLVFKEFFLRNVAYSSEYEKAFERKQITITEAQAEAEAIIYKAKAEAEAEAIASQCLCEIE